MSNAADTSGSEDDFLAQAKALIDRMTTDGEEMAVALGLPPEARYAVLKAVGPSKWMISGSPGGGTEQTSAQSTDTLPPLDGHGGEARQRYQ